MVDEILKEMSTQLLYSDVGRPSIAPERLLRSLLLQTFYSVSSERTLIAQLHAVFRENRTPLLNEEIAEGFFQRVLERAKPHMSHEHFTVRDTDRGLGKSEEFPAEDSQGKPPGAGGATEIPEWWFESVYNLQFFG